MKDKPKITITYEDSKGLAHFGTKKTAIKMGNGAAVLVPKALIGKEVDIFWLREDIKNVKGVKNGR
jgi:hypothetical protein